MAQVASDLLLDQLRGKYRESAGGGWHWAGPRPRWLVHCRYRDTRSLYSTKEEAGGRETTEEELQDLLVKC